MLDLSTEPWLAVGLAVLATWRVTHLLAREDGPFDGLARLRARMGRGFWGSLMDCFACLSVWVAAPFAWALTREPMGWVVCWLGLSGAACLIERMGEKPVVFESVPETSLDSTSTTSSTETNELLRTTTNGHAQRGSSSPDRVVTRDSGSSVPPGRD